jgi:hypothetical protein
MKLRNKHDNIPEWDIQHIEKRLHFLRGEISAGDRLDGWTLQGHKDEMCKLLNEYHDIIDEQLLEEKDLQRETLSEFEQYCLDNGIDPYLQTR